MPRVRPFCCRLLEIAFQYFVRFTYSQLRCGCFLYLLDKYYLVERGAFRDDRYVPKWLSESVCGMELLFAGTCCHHGGLSAKLRMSCDVAILIHATYYHGVCGRPPECWCPWEFYPVLGLLILVASGTGHSRTRWVFCFLMCFGLSIDVWSGSRFSGYLTLTWRCSMDDSSMNLRCGVFTWEFC